MLNQEQVFQSANEIYLYRSQDTKLRIFFGETTVDPKLKKGISL
jgi:hypothetical protein